VIGLVGAALAVISVYCIWFQYSDYALTGIQLDNLLSENFSYNIYVSVIYIPPILVLIGMILTLYKPHEQLTARSINSFLLFIAMLTTLFPPLRILSIQHISINTIRYFQYGFWILITSVGLLFYSWIISLFEVNRSLSKFELIYARIKASLNEVNNVMEIPTFARKCGISEKSLIDVWNRFKDKNEFKNFIISNDKIVNKQWLKKVLREELKKS
jgi:hypothetical protein